ADRYRLVGCSKKQRSSPADDVRGERQESRWRATATSSARPLDDSQRPTRWWLMTSAVHHRRAVCRWPCRYGKSPWTQSRHFLGASVSIEAADVVFANDSIRQSSRLPVIRFSS